MLDRNVHGFQIMVLKVDYWEPIQPNLLSNLGTLGQYNNYAVALLYQTTEFKRQ